MSTKDPKKKTRSTGPEPVDPGRSDISNVTADSLAAAPEPDPKPAAPKPEKPARKTKSPKLTDQDKSRILGLTAAIVCAGGLAVFVLYQIFSGMGGNSRQPSGDPAATDPIQTEISVPGQIGSDGELELEPSGQQSASDDDDGDRIVENPFNRGQWDDYKLETEDGEQAAQNRGDELDGGRRYWVRARDGSNVFKIIIPAGYVAGDLGDCITVGTGNYDVTGSEPFMFFWRNDAETRDLLDYGYRELAGGATGYDRYDLRALGYYMFKDENGDTWPVVTALMTRDESSLELGVYEEYWIVVGCPAPDGKYLVGTIPVPSFSDISSQLYPNVSAFAKALFPADSIPDFPDYWAIPSDQTDDPVEPAMDQPGIPTDDPAEPPDGTIQSDPAEPSDDAVRSNPAEQPDDMGQPDPAGQTPED